MKFTKIVMPIWCIMLLLGLIFNSHGQTTATSILVSWTLGSVAAMTIIVWFIEE